MAMPIMAAAASRTPMAIPALPPDVTACEFCRGVPRVIVVILEEAELETLEAAATTRAEEDAVTRPALDWVDRVLEAGTTLVAKVVVATELL